MESVIQAHYDFRISKLNTHNTESEHNKEIEFLEILYKGKWQPIDDRLLNSLVGENSHWLDITSHQLSGVLDDVFKDIKSRES